MNEEKSTQIVGRIIPFSRGEYDAEYNYDVLDQVQKGTAIYQSRKPNNCGHDVTNNCGHDVTNTEWWALYFDVGAAIEAATSNTSPETNNAAAVKRLMAIDENGQSVSIKPELLVDYILTSALNYDVLAVSKS